MKIYRESAPPTHNALRSRWPDPDRATVRTRKAKPTVTRRRKPAEVPARPLAEALGLATLEWERAVEAARKAKGTDLHSALVGEARRLRAIVVELNGGTDRKVVEVDLGSSTNPVKAV